MTRWASVEDLPPAMREQARVQIEGREPTYRVRDIVSPAILAEARDNAARDTRRRGVTVHPAGLVTLGPEVLAAIEERKSKPRKYRNEPIIVDGYRFDSKLEARYYGEVKLRQRAGYVAWFIRQVRFDLPGRVIYRADFLEVLAEGRVVVTDCKGRDTQSSINKRKQVYALYGVQVQLWTGRS